MGRKDVTKVLSEALEKYLNYHNDPRIYTAKEVTFDYSEMHPVRVDYMKFSPLNNSVSGIEKGDFFCYEIKSSVEDFKSEHGHNFIGDFNYYVMPEDVYLNVKDRIAYNVGILIPSDDVYKPLKSIKAAKRMIRKRPMNEMLLMMFRSSNRELIKMKKAAGKETEKINLIENDT